MAKQKTDDEQSVEDQTTVTGLIEPYPYDVNLARQQQEIYLLHTYIDLVVKADQADTIPNDEARTRVSKALDRLQTMAERMATA